VDIECLDEPVRDYILTVKAEADEKISSLEKQILFLTEQISLMRYKRFGTSSEALPHEMSLPFFENERAPAAPIDANDTIAVPAHERKKPGRKPLDPRLPRVTTVIDIPESEKLCGCGAHLVKIGEERCEKLHHVIEKYFVEVFVRPYWACKKCEGSGDEDKSPVRVAPMPPMIIPKGMATPDLIASIAVNKFCDHLPFYRQEQRLSRHGICISRTDMANWTIQAAQAVERVFDLLQARVIASDIINMDETSMTVMGEEGKANAAKSYMWLMRGGPPDAPIITYHYRPSHGANEARELLEGFHGILQTDGLDVYPAAIAGTDIRHVGCWAHARRYFFDASKANPQSQTARDGLAWIGKLYSIERALRKKLEDGALQRDAFKAERERLVLPVFEDFQKWLLIEAERVLPSSLAGKAVSYTLGQWEKLVRYVDHPDLTPDNNAAERAIKPFVLGRKNWLICGSPEGARCSCILYSLIETVKANGLNPNTYLTMLFHFAPMAKTDKDWERLLPFKNAFDLKEGYTFMLPPGLV
jgi:transposase